MCIGSIGAGSILTDSGGEGADRVNGVVRKSKRENRTQRVRKVLSDLARELGPDAKLSTTRELRKSLNVSQATLDSALKGLELQGLIRRRRGSGLYVSPHVRTRRIALVFAQGIFGGRANVWDQLLFKALRPVARGRNCLVTYYFFDADHDDAEHGPQQLAVDLQQGRVEAMIVSGMMEGHMRQLQALAAPCVFFTSDQACKPRVDSNAGVAIAEGVHLLARRGCRRIAMAYPDFELTGDQRSHVRLVPLFRQAMQDEGLAVQDDLLIPFHSDFSPSRPLEASTRFYESWNTWQVRPDGLFSTDDQYTSGIVQAAKLLKVRIPQDLVIASHANHGLNLFGDADVMRIELDPATIAQVLLDAVDELLAENQPVTEVRLVQPQVVLSPSQQQAVNSGVRKMN